MQSRPGTSSGREVIANLIALSRTDTLYRDLYLQKASKFLQPEMTLDGYRAHKRQLTNLVNLPNQIRNAMNDGNWHEVRRLSQEHKTLEEEIERKKPLQEFGKALYDSQDIPIDPFSPGMRSVPGVSRKNLKELRSEILGRLKALSQADCGWLGFYTQRSEAFEALSIDAESTSGATHSSIAALKDEAVKADRKSVV